ncbi:MAG: hypothetical protein WC344_00650 [Bacilli bacterium]|jgi:hypothetical protein
MRSRIILVVPLAALLTACPIVNPIYPQDKLNLDQYGDPIALDWTNENESEPEDGLFIDGEALRTYLNNPRALIKEVSVIDNVSESRGALQIGSRSQIKTGELTFALKSIFYADAIAIYAYPYYTKSLDYFTGKDDIDADTFSISINDRDYIALDADENLEPYALTFAFDNPVSEITIKTDKGRGFLYGMSIYQNN